MLYNAIAHASLSRHAMFVREAFVYTCDVHEPQKIHTLTLTERDTLGQKVIHRFTKKFIHSQ